MNIQHSYTSVLRFSLTLLLTISITTQSFAQSFIYNPEQHLKDLDTSYKESDYSPAEKAMVEGVYNLPIRETLDLVLLISALNKKAKQMIDTLGEEAVLKKIITNQENDQVKIEIPGVGKAEYNRLGERENSRVFLRVIYYKTHEVINFFDESVFSRDYLSEANDAEIAKTAQNPKSELRLRKYLRRQYEMYNSRQLMHAPRAQGQEYVSIEEEYMKHQIEMAEFAEKLIHDAANSKPSKSYDPKNPNEVQFGRNVRSYFYKNGEILSTDHRTRAKELRGLKRAVHYWSAIYETPYANYKYVDEGKLYEKILTYLTGDYLTAILATGFQTSLAYAVSYIVYQATGEFSHLPAILTIIWAGTVGVYNRTYKNWTSHNHSRFSLFVKSVLLSMSFNYTYIFFKHALANESFMSTMNGTTEGLIAGAAALSLLTTAGLYNHFLSITNTMINGWAKNWMMAPFRARERANISNTPVIVYGFDTKALRSSLEMQFSSAVGSTLKLVDLADFWSVDTPIGRIGLGRILFIGSAPIMHFVAMRYAEKKDLKEKLQFRHEWTQNKLFGIPYAKFFINVSWDFIQLPFRLLDYLIESATQKIVNYKLEEDLQKINKHMDTAFRYGQCSKLFSKY